MVKAQMERITEQLGGIDGSDVDDNSDQMCFKPDDNNDRRSPAVDMETIASSKSSR